MSANVFENLIRENNPGNVAISEEEQALLLEEEREALLKLLPEELRDRSVREKFSLEHIKKIIEFREKEGFKVITGFHVSPRELTVGNFIHPTQDGEVCFSASIESLYLGKGGSGWIYAIECSEKLMKPLDEGLNWYTLKGKIKIIDKIKMTPENIKSLRAGFAECSYS